MYTAMGLAAIAMSLIDPFILWDTGFLLSFLGTLGIVLLTPFFQRLLAPIEHLPFGHFITEIIAVTLAAQVATLPIFAVTFETISFIAPIASMLTVPPSTARILPASKILVPHLAYGTIECCIACDPGNRGNSMGFSVRRTSYHHVSKCRSQRATTARGGNLDSHIGWQNYAD
jgi:predicted membrane metal-binding protein